MFAIFKKVLGVDSAIPPTFKKVGFLVVFFMNMGE
jgi:hypothetical protein